MASVETDRGGNKYISVTDWFRVSNIQREEGGYDVRFNMVTDSGKVPQGPQINVEDIGKLFQAVVDLIRNA